MVQDCHHTGPQPWGPRDALAGVLERFKTYLQPGLEDPIQHIDLAGLRSGSGVSGVFHISCHTG